MKDAGEHKYFKKQMSLINHYYDNTLEGRIKSAPSRIQSNIWSAEDKIRTTKERITGSKAKTDMRNSKMFAKMYSDDPKITKYYNRKYSEAKEKYDSSLFGRISNSNIALSKIFKK